MFEWLKRKKRRPDPPSPGKIFPDIDVDRIASDLRLEREGSKRGEKNQPTSDEVNLDVIEQEVVDRVGEFRRMGISNFEEHSQVYADRIAQAARISTDIQTAVGDAETNFMAEINNWNGILANARNDLRLVREEFEDFRKENGLKRTMHGGGGLLQWIAVALSILVLESAMNSYFFAGLLESGYVGGFVFASVISIVNIGVATIAAWASRNSNHCRVWRKLFGIVAFLIGAFFALGFNFFVAHFRNVVEAGEPWKKAAGFAIERLFTNPLGLESIEAWILGMVGVLLAIVAGLKTYHSCDPYPGYGRVWRKMWGARAAYAQRNEEAIKAVTETRNKSVEDLRAASENAQTQIAEAVSASHESASLRNLLGSFLEQCNQKVNLLLVIYRNANGRERAAPDPEHFSKDFSFDPHEITPPQAGLNPVDATAIQELNKDIDDAIGRIYAACENAIASFKPPDDIESGASGSDDGQDTDGP